MWSLSKQRQDMEQQKTDLSITAEVMGSMMNSMVAGMTFTTETSEDFGGVWLPTLDLEICVLEAEVGRRNQLMYRFYQKPIVTGLVTHMRSAQSINMRWGGETSLCIGSTRNQWSLG